MGLSDIAIAASAKASKTKNEIDADIIEFVEASWGLKMTLFPVQKVILKAHYGLALDDTKTFKITDWTRTKIQTHTEVSYLKFLYEEGRCNIKEVIPGKQRREMILSIGRRSGKCVTGDTYVLTNQGIVQIKDLDNGTEAVYQPLSIQVAQEKGRKARTAYFYNGGVKPVRKITTKNGYQLSGTDNHRVKVMSQHGDIVWRYMSDIKEGDVICIAKGTNLWSKSYVDLRPYSEGLNKSKYNYPEVLDEEWGSLLGMLCGDGSWTSRTAISITIGEQDFQDKAHALFSKLMGNSKRYKLSANEDVSVVVKNSIDYRALLNKCGWNLDAKPTNKRVPHVIFKSPKSVVCAFLKGLFETDGTVLERGAVGYTSASETLAREVQMLLCNLGMVSSLDLSKDGKYWSVWIRHKQSRRLFKQLIGFCSDRKSDRLRDSLFSYDGEEFLHIPHQESWAELALNTLVLSKETTACLKKILNSKRYFRYRDLKSLARIAEQQKETKLADHFHDLLDHDFFYDKVVKVEEGEEKVYDLNVPEGSMFIANSMVNHNTTISACIAAYETYKLIKKSDPQDYYGLPSSNNIQIISVATDKDQAGLLYQEVSGHFRNCAFFGPYTANNTQSYARFQTPKDIERYGRYADNQGAKATLKITFRSCIAKGLRGAGNVCVILDEVAHFTDSGQSSADEVYNAVVPSTSAYSPKDKVDKRIPIGPVEGRVILISSPLGRQGLFYNMFQIGMRGGTAAENILCVQAPTWEVNPTVPASEFEKHYLKNAAVFFTEYGGEFTDRTRGWIEKDDDVYSCVDPKLKPVERGLIRRPHFIGIDLGLVGDGTAVAIGHIDGEDIVVDLVTQIKAGEGKYKDKERLDFDDVADWILDLSKRFYITYGMFDQWAGIPFEQALQKRGLSQMKSELLTKPLTSQIFQNFKDMMWDKRLRFYDNANPDVDGHAPYLVELLELQATVHSKNIITVEAPQADGKHDDMSDALVRMVWLASNHMSKQKSFGVSEGGGRGALTSRGLTFGAGGFSTNRDPRRTPPPKGRGYDIRDTMRRFGK